MGKVSRDDTEWVEMVRCPPMRTYVPVSFCLQGGPMKAEGQCEWLVEIRVTPASTPGKEPIKEVVHNYPKSDLIEKHVAMIKEKKNGL